MDAVRRDATVEYLRALYPELDCWGPAVRNGTWAPEGSELAAPRMIGMAAVATVAVGEGVARISAGLPVGGAGAGRVEWHVPFAIVAGSAGGVAPRRRIV